MDKNNSFRCVKYALIAAQVPVIALGFTGFILGLVRPDILHRTDTYVGPVDYGVSGSQLALVSCIAVVVAVAGLIGALREHFYLLLAYAGCIIAVFIFRLFWSLTAHLHQNERFVMDITVSLTLLSSLVKLFLLIFAILEALTVQNSLPLTKQKFLMLRTKLKSRANKQDDILKKKPKNSKPSVRAKLNQTDSSIYVTSSSIYGSGRRRSPVRMNGYSHHSSSSRARKYLPGVGYTSSPNTSHESSGNDSNNNKSSTLTKNGTLPLNNTSLHAKSSSSPLVIDTTDQYQQAKIPQRHSGRSEPGKHYTSDNYYHFQSPSPSTPTSLTEQPSHIKFANQPFFTYQTSNRTSTPTSSADLLMTHGKSSTTSTSASTTAARLNYSPRSALFSTPSTTTSNSIIQQLHPSTTTHQSSYLTSTTSTTLGARSRSPMYSSPRTTPAPTLIGTSTPSRLYSSSPSIVTTTSTTTHPTPQARSSIFTPGQSVQSSNLFHYSSDSHDGVQLTSPHITIRTTASNLSQTRSLFSTYTSPYNSSLASTKSSLSSSSPYQEQKSTTVKSISSTPGLASSMPGPTYIVQSPPTSPIPSQTVSQESRSIPQYLQLSLSRPTPYRSIFSNSTTETSTVNSSSTPNSNTSTLFTRSYPKTYQDYIKAYRYPTEYSTVRPTTTPTGVVTTTISSWKTSPNTFTSVMAGYNRENDGQTTTTVMQTTTQHREINEHQKQSIYYREIYRES